MPKLESLPLDVTPYTGYSDLPEVASYPGGGENPSASKPVPEPLTIIGSATALGWGVLLKRGNSKKQNKS